SRVGGRAPPPDRVHHPAGERAFRCEVARPPHARHLGRPRADGGRLALTSGGVRLGACRLPRGRCDRGAAVPLTVGTAGHIDHGKTALVEALTGKNTDRLPEEHERGISIDLGYAPLELPDGTSLSVVDVPGHERFVRTMVAGASGIDLFLLVIDVGEGARPQTHEHLAILRLLGIEQGVVALTKSDLADDETLELARVEAEELVPGAPVVAVSGRTGAGLDELRAALASVATERERHIAPTSRWSRSPRSRCACRSITERRTCSRASFASASGSRSFGSRSHSSPREETASSSAPRRRSAAGACSIRRPRATRAASAWSS